MNSAPSHVLYNLYHLVQKAFFSTWVYQCNGTENKEIEEKEYDCKEEMANLYHPFTLTANTLQSLQLHPEQ